MRTIISNQKKERDILLSRPYLTRHTKYDEDELLASKQANQVDNGSQKNWQIDRGFADAERQELCLSEF